MRKYAKSIVAVIGSLITVLLGVVPPHGTLFTVLTAVAGALTIAGVYQVPNKVDAPEPAK